MTPDTAQAALVEADNGLVAPLYFHRQLVEAADLTLDRTSHDAELARMRLLLHGWGVAAGLAPGVEGNRLTVSRGYAVTPTGEEVFLDADISVGGIVAAVVARCGADPAGCEFVEPTPAASASGARAGAGAANGNGDGETTAAAWLIARPTWADAEPRPTVPEGRGHPANMLFPSRRHAGVRLELLCDLPATHTVPAPEPYAGAGGLQAPPMPSIPGPEASFVVLGRLVARDGAVLVSSEGRLTLLPLRTLQAWVEELIRPATYYVNANAQTGGEHEVHVLGCPTPAREHNRIHLGVFRTCQEALEAARERFAVVDGCAYCLPECHTR